MMGFGGSTPLNDWMDFFGGPRSDEKSRDGVSLARVARSGFVEVAAPQREKQAS